MLSFGEEVTQVVRSQIIERIETIVLDPLLMSSSTVFQPNSVISGLLGVSKLLFVMILAARF